MLSERAQKLFIEKDYNCAESTLRAANEEYGLGLGDEDIKLISAFGGGMGCAKTCGVLCASMAVLGRMAVCERAHATDGFGNKCAELYKSFVKALGSAQCAKLKKLYRNDEVRCLKTVQLGLDNLESFIAANGYEYGANGDKSI